MGQKLSLISTIGLSIILIFNVQNVKATRMEIDNVQNVKAARMEIDLDRQCEKQYGSDYDVELKGISVDDWQCEAKKRLPIYRPVNVNAACINQYNEFSDARYSDFNDPDSWFCQVDGDELEVDLDKQCRKQYGGDFRVELKGSTVNSWKCQTEEKLRIYERVNVNDACLDQYGVSTAKYSYFYEPDSWFCEVE